MAARDNAAGAARLTFRAARWTGGRIRGQVVKRVGGPARARVIMLFAAVLALSGADSATVGAMAPQLEKALNIGPTEIGLLSSVTLLVGAIFTIPVGLMVDRVKRMPLLTVSVVLWSGASILGGVAGNYEDLLLSRLLLGAVIATAGPAIASLTGDYFAADDRGRVWAYILGGEIAGTAIGFILMGSIASLLSWRVSFILLAIPGFFLARSLYRTVPEPLRGGQSHLAPGAVDLNPSETAVMRAARGETKQESDRASELAREWARRQGIEPDPRLVLQTDARSMSLVSSVRYILKIPTNLLMIISSSMGYFYFQGLSTFALLFVRGHYHLGQAGAELILFLLVLGALIGTLISGRLTDILLHRGYLEVRVWIPAVCYLAAAGLLIPGLVASHPTPAVWFDVGGAAFLSAANPPLNAARLDIVPSGLWGRAESTRTVVRSLAQALSPLVFGGLTQLIAGIAPAQAPVGTRVHGVIGPSEARGLEITFLVLLATLIAAGVFQLRARKTYAQDIATAAASQDAQAATRVRPAEPDPRQGWST
ncbi:MAG TPA: MFS transporter [Solirubrobacteraceae bacterium]|jgi:MFS family permease|nr:MFS transporter [Solirubrobacteraceae bacterium]